MYFLSVSLVYACGCGRVVVHTALSYSDHGLEKQERNFLKSSKPCITFEGEQFRFRAYLRFYSKCKFAYTKYAQNIVVVSDWASAMWLRVQTGRVVCKYCQSHWLLCTQGNHVGIASLPLLLALDCWVWDSSGPHFKKQDT